MFRSVLRFFLCFAVPVLFSVNALAVDFAMSETQKGAPIDISADAFSTTSNGWICADGNVLIRKADVQITAEHIMINRATGEIVARDNVNLIREGQGVTRTDYLVYNYKTGEGQTTYLDVKSGVFRIIADETKRRPDGSFDLGHTLVTTCTNEASCLHYSIEGSSALFYPGEYIELEDMVLRFNSLPIFYFPWWRRSLADHYGWRFLPGYETDWGPYLLTTHKHQLVDFGGEFHDSLDSQTHIDYRTERGFALGQDFLWHFGDPEEGHIGFISAYGLRDNTPMDKGLDRIKGHDIVEENRYRFTFRHDSFLSQEDFLTVRTSYMSDSYLMEDFFEDEYEDLVQPESFASYSHCGFGWMGGIGVYHRANEFYESVNRLPDAWLDIIRTQIGESPFYYESQTSGGFIQREFPDYGISTNYVADSYDTFRFDTSHAIYLPEKFFGFLSFMPRAIYRGTFYADTYDYSEVDWFNGTNMVKVASRKPDDAGFRNVYELGAETSFKMFGLFDTDSGLVRHVIEPYVNYTYVPEPNFTWQELMQFDDVDSIGMDNSARIGVRQLLQNKKLIDGEDGEQIEDVVNLIDVDLYGKYEFDNEDDDPGLKILGIDSSFRPTESIELDLEAEYDLDKSEIRMLQFWFNIWNEERWESAGRVYYRPDDFTLLVGALTYNFSEYWAANVYGRFDAERSRLEEIAGYIQYNLDCISFRLRAAHNPAFTRDDGEYRRARMKIGFYVWLRAYAPERYERHLRDESI